MVIWFDALTLDKLKEHSTNRDPWHYGRGKNRYEIVYECAGFDIETTSIHKEDSHNAYMYIWSFTYNDLTILGSYWEEFLTLLDMLKTILDLNPERRLMCFIANESFEFQFMRKWLNVTSSFFIEERQPLYVIHDYVIEFRDALQISGGNLATLAKNYTKTQKLVGDLDYTILRNHSDAKKMKSKELQYVVNDTVILSEYMEYYFARFGSTKLPLTKTGILRNAVQTSAKNACKRAHTRLSNIIAALHPSEPLYKVMMKFLFRGGYVHGTNETVGIMLENVSGVDITSSYPDHMLVCDNYPVTKLLKYGDNVDPEEYYKLNEEFCTMALITFTNISTTTAHSIESINKVVECEGKHLDNGRILDAKKLRVFLTNLDFKIYTMFYKWDTLEVEKVWTARRGRLPRYLLDNIALNYRTKSALKMAGKNKTPEYFLAKEMVNAGYGLTVTRMRQNKIVYNSQTDEYEIDNNFVFSKEVEKQALLPQWGIWVTANARFTLLNMVYNIDMNARRHGRNSDAVYMDTDSIKIRHYSDHKDIIDKYNAAHEQKVMEMCKRYNYDYNYFMGLGSFDLELPYIKKFKHNGAKRYALKYYDFKSKEYKIETTIAGLPKKSLIKYCVQNHLSLWDVFSNKMYIPPEYANKLAASYNDNEHSDIVNGELMTEKSSVCLVPIDFTLKIDDDYLKYIEEAERRLKQGIL